MSDEIDGLQKYDFRQTLVHSMMLLKTTIHLIDDSEHDGGDDILAYRAHLMDAYSAFDPMIKRLYLKKETQLSLVDDPEPRVS